MRPLNKINQGSKSKSPITESLGSRRGALDTIESFNANRKANKQMKKNAKTDKKINKAKAPTKKELKAKKTTSKIQNKNTKVSSKAAVKTSRGVSKEIKAGAKSTRAEAALELGKQGLQDESRTKVLDTINKGLESATNIASTALDKKRSLLSNEEPVQTPAEETQKLETEEELSKKKKSLNLKIAAFVGVLILLIILYFVFRNK